MAKKLLRQKCARPTTREGQAVKCALRRAPSSICCSRLVCCVGNEGSCTEHEIHTCYPKRQFAYGCDDNVGDEEGRYREQGARSPLCGARVLSLSGWSTRLTELNIACSLAFRAELNFKGDHLIQLRTAAATGPRGDVYEDRFAALSRLDAPETPVVVPGGEGAVKAHERWWVLSGGHNVRANRTAAAGWLGSG